MLVKFTSRRIDALLEETVIYRTATSVWWQCHVPTVSRIWGWYRMDLITCLPERQGCVFMKWHDRLPPDRLSKTFFWNQDGYRVFLRLLKWLSIMLSNSLAAFTPDQVLWWKRSFSSPFVKKHTWDFAAQLSQGGKKCRFLLFTLNFLAAQEANHFLSRS